jgi:hypothetical protein
VHVRILRLGPATLALTAAALVVASPVAAAPTIEPSPKVVTYKQARVGTTQVRWVTFTNRTGSPVVFGPLGISAVGAAGFAFYGDTCGGEVVELQAGASCAYGIAFKPYAAGSFRARLVYAIGGGASLAGVELRGRAG